MQKLTYTHEEVHIKREIERLLTSKDRSLRCFEPSSPGFYPLPSHSFLTSPHSRMTQDSARSWLCCVPLALVVPIACYIG